MKKNVKLVKYALLCAISAGVVSTTLTSCKDYDDDIKNLQEQVSANKTAIDDILAKIKDGDYVQKVEAVENGVKITLGNGTTHIIKNGEKGTDGTPGLIGPAGPIGETGKTPIITINAAGNWAVDGVELKDKDGNAYPAKGAAGDPASGTSFKIDPETGELIFIDGDVKTPTGIYSNMVITENDFTVTITMPNEEGKLVTVTLPKTASAILSIEYRSPFTDDVSSQPIYTVKDGNKTILEGATVLDFKVFATNFDQTKAEYFFDLYKLTKSDGPTLSIVGTPKYKVEENGKYGILSFNVKDQNLKANNSYKTSLNAFYNGATISSEYFNIKAASLASTALNPMLEYSEEYVSLPYKTIEFKYTDKLVLNDTIALAYSDNGKYLQLNCEGYKAKFTIIEQTESAKFFKLDGDVVSLSELGNESSAGIGYTCDMKVQYYATQADGSELKIGNEATFKVKAVNQKTPATVKVSEIKGTDVITRSWSNLGSQIVKVELHKAATGLYAQFGGRDNFLSIIGEGIDQRSFNIYKKKEDNSYSLITTATWTKKGYRSGQLADSLDITIPRGSIMGGDYYIGEYNMNDNSKITFTGKINTEVTVNLNVDLKSTVIPNQYYVENGSVVIRGEFTAPATAGNDGAHTMIADLSKVFLANPNLDLTFKLADTQENAIKALINAGQLTLNGKEITLAKGIANLNLATLPKVNIKITATGYPTAGAGHLEGTDATVSFKNPVDAASLTLKGETKPETADKVEFDLSKIITELKDVKGHLLIKDSEIILSNGTTVNGWARAFNISIPAITNASIIADADAKQAFKINGTKLIYDNSAITLTKDLSVKVKVVVNSFWGPITKEATFTVKKK